MKILSIIVPSYNSEDYLSRCLNSLIIDDNRIEVIIVNDGSTDKTAEVANRYQAMYPSVVNVVHQINGGHGEAINSGLKVAKGHFVKVVDSDDWLETNAYRKIVEFLEENLDTDIDMVISNYVYEKSGQKRKKVIRYSKFLPIEQTFSWQDVHFPLGKYLLMHSVIYRTEVLRKINLELPSHTFYVDNLYVFQPLVQVRKMYYINCDLYRYFIGREDQSVNERNMINRIDQQLFVNKKMVNIFSDATTESSTEIVNYMEKYLEIITTISSVLLIKEGSKQSLTKKRELWEFIHDTNPDLYRKLRRGLLGIGVHLPGYFGRKTTVGTYKLLQKVYGFN